MRKIFAPSVDDAGVAAEVAAGFDALRTAPLITMARETIRNGADRSAVEAALERMGISADLIGDVEPSAPAAPEPAVRLATEADEDALMEFCRVIHADNGVCSFSERKVWETIRLATRGGGGIIGVIDGPNGFEASICLFLDQFYFSEDWILQERWVFVHPGHRKKQHFDRLIDYARACQAKMSEGGEFMPLFCGVGTRTRVMAKIRLWSQSFPLIGAKFAWTNPDDLPGKS